ncbi:MAG: hypothetical protein KF891_22465 [Rhizobacter sp.]|nr:hypothetical protein [Rhizobacter sp.]
MQYMTEGPRHERAGGTTQLTQLHFIDLPASAAFAQAAREQGEWLQARVPEMLGCSVTLHALRRDGACCRYVVTVDAHLPGDEFTTCRLDGRDARVALVRAFESLWNEIHERNLSGASRP